MTFTEAALEVLRSAGEPLHYKKITELAIERNLLSHVGKTPEVTMSSRLAMMVKKDRGQAPIIKVKPGVFAIRESALQGQTLSAAALAAINEVEGLQNGQLGLPSTESEIEAVEPAALTGSAEVAVVVVEENPNKTPLLPGADVFPEEEGDDDPILAGLDQESESGERGGRRRRRRRRRGKGDKPETPQSEVSVRPERSERPEPARERPREAFRSRASERHERQVQVQVQDRQERQERQDRHEERARSDERERVRGEDSSVDWNRQPAEGDLLGKDLADAVWHVLSRGERVPHAFSRVADLLVRRGRLSGSAVALAPTIAAAVRADISRAELNRTRPRFRLRGGRLSLNEWLLPKSLARADQDLLASAERYAAELRRALIQKLSELPTAGFAELLATWLNAEGVTALRAVRRPGSSGSELHFAGTRKSGSEEVRLAIVVQRGGRDIDREAVIDVRGALHHYGQAQSAWLVTLGRITSGAREEAAAQAAACALFDGNALASAMERLGVAMRRHVIAHHEIDYELLESLGDSPEERERREREEERERRTLGVERERPGRPERVERPERERFTSGHERSTRSANAAFSSPAAVQSQAVETENEAPSAPARRLIDADWDEEEDDDDVLDEQDEHQISIAPAPEIAAKDLGDALPSGVLHREDDMSEDVDIEDADELEPGAFGEDEDDVDDEDDRDDQEEDSAEVEEDDDEADSDSDDAEFDSEHDDSEDHDDEHDELTPDDDADEDDEADADEGEVDSDDSDEDADDEAETDADEADDEADSDSDEAEDDEADSDDEEDGDDDPKRHES